MGVPQRRHLFRQEVIEFQRRTRHWGRAVPIQPWPVRLTFWFITGSMVAVIAFLFLSSYARKETVTGYLTPAAGTVRMFPSRPGIISAVQVSQGQAVTEGQPMFTVAVDQITTDGKDVDTTILATLESQKQSITRQIAAEEARGASEQDRLTAQIKILEIEIDQIAAQMSLQAERVRVAEKSVAAGAQLLPKGLVSEIGQRGREEVLLEQRVTLNGMFQQQTKSQGLLNDARFNLAQLPTITAEKLRQLHSALADTEQRITEVSGRHGYVIRAPISGRVSMLQATAGEVADPKHLLAQVMPGDSPLEANLFVPVRAIGFVKPGEPIRILYDAFPYQHYGTYKGEIVSISQTIVTANDIVAPVKLDGPAYRAIATIDRPDINAYGKRVPLQPDMLLHADVILEHRSLIQWVLNPLRSARG
jgi:membrane fusion protein